MGKAGELGSALSLGKKQLKNRIVFGPHRTNFAVDRSLSQQHLAYYLERAKGGAGLIIAEGAAVLPGDCPYENSIDLAAPNSLENYHQLANSVHRHGASILASLHHFGGQSDSSITRRELWAPSPVPELNSGEVPKIMEEEDIEAVVAGFVRAAEMVSRAGLDGVEINAGQFSLLRQFLSPLTNFRQDGHGGSLINRARLTLRVLERVRLAIGPDKIIGLRLCGDEYAPWGGLTMADAREIAVYLQSQVPVDYLAVEMGSLYSAQMTMASMRFPENYALPAAELIAADVDCPVCVTGSIVSVSQAEAALAAGCRLVEMTRALIADPQLPLKLAAGQTAQIRPCILCNQDCYVTSAMNPRLACAINPRAGRELLSGQDEVTAEQGDQPVLIPKNIIVVGGGPAGLQAALSAARRGHRVSLYEKSPVLGGRLRLAAKVPGNERFQTVIDYLAVQARQAGVAVHLDTLFSEAMLDGAARPDALIVAAGSRPAPLPFPVEDGVAVLGSGEILSGEKSVSGTVLLIDLEGTWQGAGTALLISDSCQKIYLVTPDLFAASQLAKNGSFISLYQAAWQKGIQFLPQQDVLRVGRGEVEMADRFSQQKQTISGIDAVIFVAPPYPEDGLIKSLLEKDLEIWSVGDCVAPRNYSAAIREGWEVGRMI